MGLYATKPVFGGLRTTKAADQPAHSCRLICAFAIRFLLSIISRLATSEISTFYLVSVAEQIGLNLAFFRNPEDWFSHIKDHIDVNSFAKI